MSTGPDRGHPAFAAGPSGPSLGWRIRHSLWLLIPALGVGCLGGLGFLYVGIRARRPAWWIAGICYLVLGWASFIVVGESPQQSTVGAVGVWVFLFTYLASLIHAGVINGAWLRWRANWVPWYAQPTAPPPPGHPGSAHYGPPHPAPVGYLNNPYGSPALPPGLVPPPESFYGPGPSAAPAPPVPSVPPGAAPAPSTAGPPSPSVPGPPQATPVGGGAGAPAPLDVNTASYEQLVALPGFDPDRAVRVLTQRQAQRGFGSVQEFAAVAGLAPHEFARLRDRLVCAPPPRPGQTVGPVSAPPLGPDGPPAFGHGGGPAGGHGFDDDGWRPPHQGRVLDV
jgi:DNA uptake protein and related DNA-binding proteins